jgi:hypothetical protein
MARAEVTQDDRDRPGAQGIEERERDPATIGVDLGAFPGGGPPNGSAPRAGAGGPG